METWSEESTILWWSETTDLFWADALMILSMHHSEKQRLSMRYDDIHSRESLISDDLIHAPPTDLILQHTLARSFYDSVGRTVCVSLAEQSDAWTLEHGTIQFHVSDFTDITSHPIALLPLSRSILIWQTSHKAQIITETQGTFKFT